MPNILGIEKKKLLFPKSSFFCILLHPAQAP